MKKETIESVLAELPQSYEIVMDDEKQTGKLTLEHYSKGWRANYVYKYPDIGGDGGDLVLM